ncbi:MAG: triose-phosphate isomerase [Ruminococcaceae bacterium]|nr:triose-phosphate isomerase [Oscillospiraceae bacterium]
MRQIVAAGNWKMNMTPSETKALISELAPLVKDAKNKVIVCPTAVCLPAAVEAAKGTNILVGAQNMYFEDKGAFTGEISADMLLDLGIKYVILGHSERRQYFAETDETVNKKVLKAFEKGLTPIICVGESLEQREQGVTADLVRMQVKIALQGVTADQAKNTIIAYEPIWAIGTGKTATTEQAEEVCKTIRDCVCELYDCATAEAITIQYGGSVNAKNSAELFAQENIDGGLVGGASLKAADFSVIANS